MKILLSLIIINWSTQTEEFKNENFTITVKQAQSV